jgi:hypothetical protein
MLRRSLRATLAGSLMSAFLAIPSSAMATDTYACTSGSQTATAPANAVQARVQMKGGAGGGNFYFDINTSGGNGADITFTMPVTGGQKFAVNVGCEGNSAQQGGWGAARGGDAGLASRGLGGQVGGGGGGATDIEPFGGGFSSAYGVAGGGGGIGGGSQTYPGNQSYGTNGGNADTDGPNGVGNPNDPDFSATMPGDGGRSGDSGGGGGLSYGRWQALNGTTASSGDGGGGGSGGKAGESGGSFDGGGGGGGGGGVWGGGGGGGGSTDSQMWSSGGGGGGGGESYVPSGHGVSAQSFTVDSSGDGSVSITYMFPPNASVSPTARDYGTVTTGQSASQRFTVTNTGDLKLNVSGAYIDGLNADQFSIANDRCSHQTVTSTSTCTIDLTFSPSSDTPLDANLEIPSNSPSGLQTLPVSGTGTYPADMSVSPGDFGTVTTDEHSPPRILRITNSGDLTLNVGQASISGATTDEFAVLSDNCSGQSLSGRSTCTIAVQFSPTSNGGKATQLSIPSNALSGSPTIVALSGTGANPAAISVTPTSADFGTVADGETYQTETVTVTNTGDNALGIGSASITGTNSDQFSVMSGQDGCSGGSVGGGGTCTIRVVFVPTSVGMQSAQLSIPSKATSSPVTVALSGTGAAVLAPAPAPEP